MKEKRSVPQKNASGTGEWLDSVLLYGNGRAVIRECRKILSYAPEEICIALHKENVRLTGKNLRCVSFAAGSTTVEGLIRSVVLESTAGKGKPT